MGVGWIKESGTGGRQGIFHVDAGTQEKDSEEDFTTEITEDTEKKQEGLKGEERGKEIGARDEGIAPEEVTRRGGADNNGGGCRDH